MRQVTRATKRIHRTCDSSFLDRRGKELHSQTILLVILLSSGQYHSKMVGGKSAFEGTGRISVTEIPHLDEVVREGRALRNLQKELREAILTDHPEFDEETVVDYQTLIRYKVSCYESVFESDSEQYKRLHEEILRSIQENETITETTLSADVDDDLPLGQRAADKIAKFGGSWPFITLFISVLLAWVVTNTFALIGENFDPYPYVLLNLGLSCLAAIQAPIIMMSQNRQADRDRQRELNDYKVNLKSEIEIKLLHEKIDYLLQHPWNHMTEIQSFQAELLQDLQHEVKDLKLVVHKHIINDT